MKSVSWWVTKGVLTAALWVFILSIRWGDRTLFAITSDVLVHNAIVSALDESLADLWYRVSETAQVTFHDVTKSSKQEVEDAETM